MAWKRVDFPTLASPTCHFVIRVGRSVCGRKKEKGRIFQGGGKGLNRRGKKKGRLAVGWLTYDTTLQVITWTAQKDLFLNGGLFRGHLLAFLLAGGMSNGGKGEEWTEWGRRRGKRRSRTSCGGKEGKNSSGTDGGKCGAAHGCPLQETSQFLGLSYRLA